MIYENNDYIFCADAVLEKAVYNYMKEHCAKLNPRDTAKHSDIVADEHLCISSAQVHLIEILSYYLC